MAKLTDNSGSNHCVNEINNSLHSENELEVQFFRQERQNSTEVRKPHEKQKVRRKKTPFSSVEDHFLQSGIKKYGGGKWSSIIKDPEYKFDPSRQVATLQVRAKLKGFV